MVRKNILKNAAADDGLVHQLESRPVTRVRVILSFITSLNTHTHMPEPILGYPKYTQFNSIYRTGSGVPGAAFRF